MPQSRTLSIGLEVHKASIAVAYAAKDITKLVFPVIGMDNTGTLAGVYGGKELWGVEPLLLQGV